MLLLLHELAGGVVSVADAGGITLWKPSSLAHIVLSIPKQT